MVNDKSDGKQQFYRLLFRLRPTILADILKRFLGLERIVLQTEGWEFWVDPVSLLGQTLLEKGVYEPDTLEVLRRYLHEGDVFVDVGANEGYFSVFGAGLVGSGGQVIAIEPQSRCVKVIKRNLELNNIDNVDVLNVAVSEDQSSKDIWLSPSTQTGSSSFVRKYFISRCQRVNCKTLDQILDSLPEEEVTLVKIDVEGFEPEVLRGGYNSLEKHRITYLFVDFHSAILRDRGISVHKLDNFVTQRGYQLVHPPLRQQGYNLYQISV